MNNTPYVTEKGYKIPRFKTKITKNPTGKTGYEITCRADTIEELMTSLDELKTKMEELL